MKTFEYNEITLQQARRFILLKQGLLGEYKFFGKAGALDYVRQAGCIQFDPVDVCGRMAELALQSRVKDFAKNQLDELLYSDRALFDYPDSDSTPVLSFTTALFDSLRAIKRQTRKRLSFYW